jgi:ABC-type sugar transport system ATPase subunit
VAPILVLQLPAAENITLTSLDEFSRCGILDLTAAWANAGDLVERQNIRIVSADQEVTDVSGGNQQKVVLAPWLAARCKVVLFGEPSRGIDVGAKAEICELISGLVERGVAVLLISREIPELLGLSDRILVMHDGAVQGMLPRAEATQERIMELALR